VSTLRYRIEIGWLFRAGMVIFLVTVAIGIANGTKIFGTLPAERSGVDVREQNGAMS
jgi:hypothetical protein